MKQREKLSLIFNALILVMELVALSMPAYSGFTRFEYYTVLSNYLMIIPSLLMVVYILIKKSLSEIPYVVIVMKYALTIALTLTLIIVLTVLIPSEYGLSNYLQGLGVYILTRQFIYWHLLCPILSIISFIFFEGDRRLNKKKTMYYPCLYTLIYAFVLVILNITGVVAGPYPFFMVLSNPWYVSIVSYIAIGAVNYLLSRYVLLANQIRAPRIKLKH